MRERKPVRVGFCWLLGREVSRKMLVAAGCMDPEKQINGTCKHYQAYGERGRVTNEPPTYCGTGCG